jgi:hypothetical protein
MTDTQGTKPALRYTAGEWDHYGTTTIRSASGKLIAEVYDGDDGTEGEANRDLISAAPDLLKACQIAVSNLAPLYPSDHLVMKRLRAALAKAGVP